MHVLLSCSIRRIGACTDMQDGQHAGVMCSGGGFLLGISMRPRLAGGGGTLVNTEHCAHG